VLGVSTAALSKVENKKMGPGLELYFVMCSLMNVSPLDYMNKEVLRELKEKTDKVYQSKFRNRYYSRYGR
jgi:DNA-binding XRE family transcriptional regulator